MGWWVPISQHKLIVCRHTHGTAQPPNPRSPCHSPRACPPVMLPHVLLPALLCAAPAPAPAAPQCTFCGTDAAGKAVTFDLSGLPSTTWSLDGVGKDGHPIVGEFSATAPCGAASKASCGPSADPVLQECRGLGSLVGTNASVVLASDGFNLTLRGGDDDPPMKNGQYRMRDETADGNVPSRSFHGLAGWRAGGSGVGGGKGWLQGRRDGNRGGGGLSKVVLCACRAISQRPRPGPCPRPQPVTIPASGGRLRAQKQRV